MSSITELNTPARGVTTVTSKTSLKQLRLQYAMDVKRFGKPEVDGDVHDFGGPLMYRITDAEVKRVWRTTIKVTVTVAQK